jgi:flavin reductase (DIM6/NTAB) family NADH-FMN oxidoreductase RutF
MTDDDQTRHFYEPARGHGLRHDPFNAIVAPRPIGWISTYGRGGINLAPYSFFNAFAYVPPVVGFSSTGDKHSLHNARETGEFVWNMVTFALAEAMNQTSATVDYGIDELALAGLTALPCRHVAPPRVGESPVTFECKVADIIPIRGHDGTPSISTLVLGEVVGVHIDRTLIKDGIFDTFAADIVARAGGPSAYVRVSPQTRFDIRRPD